MRIEQNKIAFAYFRLSREEAQKSESSSITNQRMIVNKYCEQNGINLVREFVDDGYSGGVPPPMPPLSPSGFSGALPFISGA